MRTDRVGSPSWALCGWTVNLWPAISAATLTKQLCSGELGQRSAAGTCISGAHWWKGKLGAQNTPIVDDAFSSPAALYWALLPGTLITQRQGAAGAQRRRSTDDRPGSNRLLDGAGEGGESDLPSTIGGSLLLPVEWERDKWVEDGQIWGGDGGGERVTLP